MTRVSAYAAPAPGAPLVPFEYDLGPLAPDEVEIAVAHCGICHSDMYAKLGAFPGVTFPVVPGHEIAGRIAALGEGVNGWEEGQRVGVGWFGGNCGWCEPCRRGQFISCQNMGIPGVTMDGGYADYVVVPASALASIPDDLDAAEAAPLLCAGITTFNALRHSSASGGDLVAVLGVGGLGHLGVQFAARMGFHTVAISRGADKERFAKELGAHEYVDAAADDAAAKLTAMGGARVILATAPNAAAISSLVPGLGIDGTLVMVGAPHEPLQIGAIDLIGRAAGVRGWASGDGNDSTDALAFAHRMAVRSHNEVFPLADAAKGYQRMLSGEARFRVVLDVAS